MPMTTAPRLTKQLPCSHPLPSDTGAARALPALPRHYSTRSATSQQYSTRSATSQQPSREGQLRLQLRDTRRPDWRAATCRNFSASSTSSSSRVRQQQALGSNSLPTSRPSAFWPEPCWTSGLSPRRSCPFGWGGTGAPTQPPSHLCCRWIRGRAVSAGDCPSAPPSV